MRLAARGRAFLTGDGNVNILEGGSGDDRLRGFGNADVLDGEIGTDTTDYSAFYSANRSVGVIVDLSAGDATGDGADSLAGIEERARLDFSMTASLATVRRTVSAAATAGTRSPVGAGTTSCSAETARISSRPGTASATASTEVPAATVLASTVATLFAA